MTHTAHITWFNGELVDILDYWNGSGNHMTACRTRHHTPDGQPTYSIAYAHTSDITITTTPTVGNQYMLELTPTHTRNGPDRASQHRPGPNQKPPLRNGSNQPMNHTTRPEENHR